jgi:hypothetical protein
VFSLTSNFHPIFEVTHTRPFFFVWSTALYITDMH